MLGLGNIVTILFFRVLLFDSPTATSNIGVLLTAFGLVAFTPISLFAGWKCIRNAGQGLPKSLFGKFWFYSPFIAVCIFMVGLYVWEWEGSLKFSQRNEAGQLQSGCVWRELTDTIISAKVESCKVGTYALEVMLDERGLERKITYDDGTTAKTRIVELFKKRSGEAPEHVLERLFIDTLPTSYEREHCVVKERAPGFSAKGFADKSKRAFQITPDAIYFDKLEKEADGGIPEDSCNTNGEYGFYADGVYYFEFHEGSDNFVWVANAEEDPGFDQQSLIF